MALSGLGIRLVLKDLQYWKILHGYPVADKGRQLRWSLIGQDHSERCRRNDHYSGGVEVKTRSGPRSSWPLDIARITPFVRAEIRIRDTEHGFDELKCAVGMFQIPDQERRVRRPVFNEG